MNAVRNVAHKVVAGSLVVGTVAGIAFVGKGTVELTLRKKNRLKMSEVDERDVDFQNDEIKTGK